MIGMSSFVNHVLLLNSVRISDCHYRRPDLTYNRKLSHWYVEEAAIYYCVLHYNTSLWQAAITYVTSGIYLLMAV